MSSYQNIMMVCVGNICRSPMAEAYFKHHHPQLNIYSSGLRALVGESADKHSISVMDNRGIYLHEHTAQQISAKLVSRSDLILTMEKAHIDAIHNQFPTSLGKVYLIGKWSMEEEIADPYKKPIEAFEKAAIMIESGIDTWRDKI